MTVSRQESLDVIIVVKTPPRPPGTRNKTVHECVWARARVGGHAWWYVCRVIHILKCIKCKLRCISAYSLWSSKVFDLLVAPCSPLSLAHFLLSGSAFRNRTLPTSPFLNKSYPLYFQQNKNLMRLSSFFSFCSFPLFSFSVLFVIIDTGIIKQLLAAPFQLSVPWVAPILISAVSRVCTSFSTTFSLARFRFLPVFQ